MADDVGPADALGVEDGDASAAICSSE